MVEKLNEVLESLNDLLEDIKNLNQSLLSSDFISELQKRKRKLQKFHDKFKKNLLEVAITGPEKAGKSALSNAIIGKELLPSRDERATYIITMVVYGEKLKVEIEFYTKDEFNTFVLQSLLKTAGFKNYDKFTIDDVENLKAEIERIKEQEPEFYDKLKSKRYDKEIEEIIENKEKILEFLDSPKKEFVDTEAHISNYDKYITDPGISRAVKQIKIYTPTLKGISNVILYDLPGFDSPTVIHSEFTRNMLREVDAIIYLRRFDEPSLKGHELDIFDEVREEDGLAIKDKLFFFLTRIDTAKTKTKINETIEKFIEDLKKWGLFINKDRIIGGSALAYMAAKNIVTSEEAQQALKDLEELGVSNGIDELFKRLEEYNRTERRRILEDRVKSVLRDLKDLLGEVYIDVSALAQKDETVKVLEMKDRIKEKLKEVGQRLGSYINEIMEEIRNNQELSRKILEKYKIELTMLDEEKRKILKEKMRSETYTQSDKIEKYNLAVREELFKEINEKIHKLPEEIVIDKQNEVKEKVIEIILNTLVPDKREEFREKLSTFIDENLKHYLSEIYGIKVVFLRFIGGFMEFLIRYPKASTDRLRTFSDIRDDIALVSSTFDKDGSPLDRLTVPQDFGAMSDEELQEEILSRIKFGMMGEMMGERNKIKNELASLSRPKLQELYLRLMQFQYKENKEEVSVEEFADLLAHVKVEETASLNLGENKPKKPVEYLKEFLDKKEEEFEEIKERINFMNQEVTDADREIEKDLEDFKNIIEHVLIRAINPEKTFEIVVKDFANKLKEVLTGREGDEFFNENLKLIYYKEFQSMDNVRKTVILAKEILQKTSNLIEDINIIVRK